MTRITAERNVGGGISITDMGNVYEGGLVEDSVVTGNSQDGVFVGANNVTVRNGVIDSTNQNAVYVAASFDVIEGNTIQGTNVGAGVYLSSTSSIATVAHNVFSNLTGGAVNNGGGGNRIGPLDSTLAGTQPWSNAGP